MLLAGAAGPSPFWFITRATGAVSLVLLTLSVTLGIVNVRRTQIAGVPRFVLDSVHLVVHLQIAPGPGTASGSVTATPETTQ